MQKHRVNVCHFCLSPEGVKFDQLGDCIEPPKHARFDGSTELRNAVKKILETDAADESKYVCVRCNEKFQQIYTFMDCCSKNVLSPVENSVVRATKVKTIASSSSIGQYSQLTTFPRKEVHGDSVAFQISKFKKMKKSVVRLKRLKMVTFAVKVTSECDINSCCTTGYSRVKNNSDRNAYEANRKDSKIRESPEIEDIKSEILEDIYTEEYQVIETSNASERLVQKVLPKEESIGLAYTSHPVLSSDQSDMELHRASKLKQSPNVWRHKHGTASNKRYQCDRCEKYFSDLFRLKRHQEIHSGKGFECDQCNGCFPTEQHLRRHVMRRHEIKTDILKDHQTLHTGKTVQCDQCDAFFYTRRMLLSHKSKEHSNVRYKCDQCDKDFISMINLRNHKQLHAEIIFDCDQCSKKFRASQYLQKHKRERHNGLKRPYKCEPCEKEFSSHSYLKVHLLIHQNVTFACDFCEAKYSQKCSMLRHRRLHTGETFNCSCCNKRFTRSSELKKHLDKCKQRILMTADETAAVPELIARDSYNNGIKIRFNCDLCEKYFDSIYRLKDHQRLHTGKSVVCDQCGIKFGTKSLLHAHKSKEHSRSKERYRCDQCEKDIGTISNLRAHQKIHAGIIFDCDNCDAKFPTSSYLQKHKLYMHSGLGKRYKCEQCEKNFRSKSHLRAHQKIHAGIVFDCDNCDAKFPTSVYLRKHKLNMHSGLRKRYKCEQCEKEFSAYSSLKIHRRRHTDEAINCSLCDMHFTLPGALQKHLSECKEKMHMAANKTFRKFQETLVVPVQSVIKSQVTAKRFPELSNKELLKLTKSEDDSNEEWLHDDIIDKNIVKSSVENDSETGQRVFPTGELNTGAETTNNVVDIFVSQEKLSQYSGSNRWYKCNQCEKDFTALSSLKRHSLIHQNVTFPCDLCGKKFSTKSNMLHHRRLHTGGTFNCNNCSETFRRDHFLQKHLRICKENM